MPERPEPGQFERCIGGARKTNLVHAVAVDKLTALNLIVVSEVHAAECAPDIIDGSLDDGALIDLS